MGGRFLPEMSGRGRHDFPLGGQAARTLPESVFRYPISRRLSLQGDIFLTESWRAGSSVDGSVSSRQLVSFRFFSRICVGFGLFSPFFIPPVF